MTLYKLIAITLPPSILEDSTSHVELSFHTVDEFFTELGTKGVSRVLPHSLAMNERVGSAPLEISMRPFFLKSFCLCMKKNL